MILAQKLTYLFNKKNERLSDSTITPPKAGNFFNEDFMATRHEEGCYDKAIFIYVCCCLQSFKDYVSKDDVGVGGKGHRIS